MTTIVLKSGTKWFVPPDCQSATIEAIGAGSTAGGSYAKSTNVAFTPGTYVDYNIPAGGSGGKTWLNTNAATAVRYSFNYIIWTGSLFVCQTGNGTGDIITSPDCVTWTLRPGALALFPTGSQIAYGKFGGSGNNIVFAAADNSTTNSLRVVYSTDGGATWAVASSITNMINAPLIYGDNTGNTIVVTQNQAGTSYQYWLFNGSTWSQVQNFTATGTSPSVIGGSSSFGVVYANGNYVAPGYWYVSSVLTSGIGYSTSLGSSQTFVDSSVIFPGKGTYASNSISVQSIAYGNGIWVAVGNYNTAYNVISTATSLSGPWTINTTTLRGSQVVFDGTKFIITDGNITNSGSVIYTSSNGLSWSSSSPIGYPPTTVPNLILVGSTIYGYNYTLGIVKSTNSASTWTRIQSGDGSPLTSAYGVSITGYGPTNSSFNAVYTSGAGNYYYGGVAGTGDCCCGTLVTTGGGGGAAGPNGNGGNGGNGGPLSTDGNGGGGGANGGSNGASSLDPMSNGTGQAGGAGGDGRLGHTTAPGGAGGASGNVGSAGSNGGGGGGGGYSGTGGAGSLDIISQWQDFAGNTYGVGSGGGGGNGTASGAAGGPGGGGSGTLGQGLIIITYTPTTVASGPYTQVITSSQDVYLPAGITTLTAYAIGPGSNGGKYTGTVQHGGGGGAYALSTTTYAFTATGIRAYATVPAALTYGSTADTWFAFSGNSTPVSTSTGVLAKGASGQTGGLSGASIGFGAVFSGGSGGASFISSARQRGGGGGGAAGPGGNGLAGGAASTSATAANGSGGGGGGTNGGSATAGSQTLTTTGGAGGTGPTGTAGGTGGTTAANATTGTNGSGGGGGGASTTVSTAGDGYRSGANGSQYTIWTANSITYGPGSGGGGAAQPALSTVFGNGGNSVGYGGGGGAASAGSSSVSGTAGTGGSGLVVLVYYVTTVTQATVVVGNVSSKFFALFF